MIHGGGKSGGPQRFHDEMPVFRQNRRWTVFIASRLAVALVEPKMSHGIERLDRSPLGAVRGVHPRLPAPRAMRSRGMTGPCRAASLAALMVALASDARAQDDRRDGSGAGTWAFEVPRHAAQERAALDLRPLNEKEAGQSGFVRLSPDGEGFALGDGQSVRFWAIGSSMGKQPPDEVARHVRFLAKVGVNMVRIHSQIAPKGRGSRITDVDEEEINGIWRFVASAKAQGIYTTISPYWASSAEVTGWGIEGYTGSTPLWGLLFFDEALQGRYKAWIRALYAPPIPTPGSR